MVESKKDRLKELFEGSKFDVEHALSMYANSFCILPAEFIYEKDVLKAYEETIKRCHIYIIGYLPTFEIVNALQEDENIKLELNIMMKKQEVILPLPKNCKLIWESGSYYFLRSDGQKFALPAHEIVRLTDLTINFDVRYIGQAYGKDGSRNAIDRLLKHETLQKIALKGVPDGYILSLLLLEVEPNNQIMTLFNPFAKIKDDDGVRLKAGLDKLFNTNEQERISLYEAALIRYFYPQFNKEFKNSFPSTNLKVLQDCYEKDFSAVFAEICINDLPFELYSETVEAKHYHFAKHDLHKEKDRKAFFYG